MEFGPIFPFRPTNTSFFFPWSNRSLTICNEEQTFGEGSVESCVQQQSNERLSEFAGIPRKSLK